MNINIPAVSAIIFFLCACEQNIRSEDVPENIRGKFNTLYPAAGNVQWDKEIKNYKAYFTNSGKDISILFDRNGNVRETEVKINENELPEAIVKTIRKEYSSAKFNSFSRIYSRDMIEYMVKMHIKTEDYKVFFTQDGKLIKQVLNTKKIN